VHALPRLVAEGWSINSIFRAQAGRPFTAFVHSDTSNQGLRTTYANYDGSPLNYNLHDASQFLNVGAFSIPLPGTVGNAGRNSLRQPGISQLDVGIFKEFKFAERYSVKFKWNVFNVLNHAMFSYSTGNIKTCSLTSTAPKTIIPGTCGTSGFGTFSTTPDVSPGLSPVLGTGAQRNMQFGVAVDF